MPKIGNVQARWGQQAGRRVLILQAGLNLSQSAIALPEALAPLIALCDGTRDLSGLRASLMVRVGVRISEDNLEHVGSINPRLLKTVKVLAVSDPLPLPILCYVKGAVPTKEVERMQKALLSGQNGGKAARVMEMLQIDAWRIPDAK